MGRERRSSRVLNNNALFLHRIMNQWNVASVLFWGWIRTALGSPQWNSTSDRLPARLIQQSAALRGRRASAGVGGVRRVGGGVVRSIRCWCGRCEACRRRCGEVDPLPVWEARCMGGGARGDRASASASVGCPTFCVG
eukprot:363999-Chlamydomonas_euryale.AAC.16